MLIKINMMTAHVAPRRERAPRGGAAGGGCAGWRSEAPGGAQAKRGIARGARRREGGIRVADWIGAAAAAQRLGIKQASLYSYVSRGVLTRRAGPDGRASLFDAGEVESLARRGRPRREPGAAELVIESALTEIDGDRLWYRGLDATALAASRTFEEVAGSCCGRALSPTPPRRRPGTPPARPSRSARPPRRRCRPARCRWSGCRSSCPRSRRPIRSASSWTRPPSSRRPAA